MTRASPTTPLREAVLAGQFFGQGHAAAAERLAAFLHGGDGRAAAAAELLLAEWFGRDALLALARGRPGALRAALDRDIARLDALMGEQLDAVLHAPRLQRLEGRWRGLHWLAAGIEPGRRVKLRVLNVAWPELCRDLERAVEFDQSTLFSRIYEDEFGTPGGEPFGLLVVDHELRHRPSHDVPTDDVGAVSGLAAVAAAAFAPTVLAAHPALLEVDDFGDLDIVQDVAAPLRGADHTRWRSLAGRADTRFLAVALPRLLARHPWADDPARQDGFRYREHAPDASSRVWMTAGFAFAACVARAFVNHGWPADVRGAETDRVGGGLVTGLAPEPFASGPPEAWGRPAVEIQLTERQERALVEARLMPISALPYGSELVFGSVCSLHKPLAYTGLTATAAGANARLSAQINSILCASRFAHHLKVMGRAMVGSVETADAIERRLQAWLQGYVNTNTTSSGESRVQFPLIAGNVEVREKPGRPGVFSCTIHLQPHYQLDDVAATFSLVTELAAPSGNGR